MYINQLLPVWVGYVNNLTLEMYIDEFKFRRNYPNFHEIVCLNK